MTVAAGAQSPDRPPHDLCIWFDRPARQWEEALPIGSGRMGAMIFGGTDMERVQFNEDTLWTGRPRDYVREGAGEHLAEIRRLIFDGRADEAAPLVREKFLSDPVRQKAYQPFGDLRFAFPGHDEATDYLRWLDLDSALVTVTYRVGDTQFTREAFASHPDRAIVVRITASRPGAVAFTLKLDSPHQQSGTTAVGRDTLVLSGRVRDPIAPDDDGLRFESRVRVISHGGQISAEGDVIEVRSADAVTIHLVAATSYVSFRDIGGDPAAICQADLKRLEGKAYEDLRDRHVSDHRSLFRRVSLDLGRTARAEQSTDDRLRLISAAANDASDAPHGLSKGGLDADPALVALYFQMGRYMLIASSRPGDQPANLQGVWNELLAPPWESKYTTNINAQMNYWPAEVTNLAECHEPLFDMIDDLRVSGAITAKEMYGARGWVLHHNTDHWRGTAPINNIDGMWPTGGAWLCHHLWERYLFNGDEGFLRERAYPAMKEASLFFVDSLVADPKTGWLVTNPSHSPEQGPLCAGPAMDVQLIRALFDHTIAAAELLGVDAEFVAQMKRTRSRLPPDRIGRHGQLQEWLDDVDVPENNHRHLSPLWGLFPGAQFTPDGDENIFNAARLLLKWRGDGTTGWSYAWRMPLWARVGDGDFAYRQLYLQLAKRTFPNLFDKCGPFQVDGNFGSTAGVAEMLLQSHRRDAKTGEVIIELLPALPAGWRDGSVKGLRARGGLEVDLTWKDGELRRADLRSTLKRPCVVAYRDKRIALDGTSHVALNAALTPVSEP